MVKVARSPLTSADLDALGRLAAKANQQGRRLGLAPLYLAVDAGDEGQPDGYLLLCWPAMNQRAAHAVRLIFDYIADVAEDAFGAVMVPTAPEATPDGTH